MKDFTGTEPTEKINWKQNLVFTGYAIGVAFLYAASCLCSSECAHDVKKIYAARVEKVLTETEGSIHNFNQKIENGQTPLSGSDVIGTTTLLVLDGQPIGFVSVSSQEGRTSRSDVHEQFSSLKHKVREFIAGSSKLPEVALRTIAPGHKLDVVLEKPHGIMEVLLPVTTEIGKSVDYYAHIRPFTKSQNKGSVETNKIYPVDVPPAPSNKLYAYGTHSVAALGNGP